MDVQQTVKLFKPKKFQIDVWMKYIYLLHVGIHEGEDTILSFIFRDFNLYNIRHRRPPTNFDIKINIFL